MPGTAAGSQYWRHFSVNGSLNNCDTCQRCRLPVLPRGLPDVIASINRRHGPLVEYDDQRLPPRPHEHAFFVAARSSRAAGGSLVEASPLAKMATLAQLLERHDPSSTPYDQLVATCEIDPSPERRKTLELHCSRCGVPRPLDYEAGSRWRAEYAAAKPESGTHAGAYLNSEAWKDTDRAVEQLLAHAAGLTAARAIPRHHRLLKRPTCTSCEFGDMIEAARRTRHAAAREASKRLGLAPGGERLAPPYLLEHPLCIPAHVAALSSRVQAAGTGVHTTSGCAARGQRLGEAARKAGKMGMRICWVRPASRTCSNTQNILVTNPPCRRASR